MERESKNIICTHDNIHIEYDGKRIHFNCLGCNRVFTIYRDIIGGKKFKKILKGLSLLSSEIDRLVKGDITVEYGKK